jgi:methanogenic corrinoid protein MtbC1
LKKGYKIGDFKDVSEEEIIQLVKKTTHRIPELENFLTAMLNFDFAYFDKIFDEAINSHGFDKTIDLILYPLLERLGFLWLTDSISPAHEHFVSNIMRQKLFRQIDQLDEKKESGKTFILFLPYYEQHETSLLLAYYLIKKQGHNVIYLGQNVPTDDIIKVGSDIKPDFLVCFFITHMPKEEITHILDKTSDSLPETILLAGGSQLNKDMKFKNKNIVYLAEPGTLKKYLTGSLS